jgi:ABC-2 type transport system permease protein
MFFLSLKNFIASRVVIIGLAIVFLAGVIGINIGSRHLQRQADNVKKTAQVQSEHIKRNVQFFNKDMGLLMYYLRFAYINKAPELNGLSIGQRDINNSIQFINIRNLEAQKYDTDLYNPNNLLAGNLDFGFVLIYLFPLLIIAVTYNLLSEEREAGTWPLVSVQSRRPVSVLLQKLFIRVLVIVGLLALLFAVAIVVLPVPFDAALAATILLATVYLLFWFTVCFWVVSWMKPSATNAASLLTTWVLLTIILPSVVNNFISARYPVPEALATTIKQREGYHAKWDTDKKATLDSFYAHHPQVKKYPMPNKQFSWLWYYAMQQAGDDDARVHSAEMKEKLRMRIDVSNRIALFIPSLHTQLRLNELSQSGLDNHLRFLDSTEKFHERLRLHFYPKIFEESDATVEDWSRFQPVYCIEPVKPDHGRIYIPLVIIIGVLVLMSWGNFRRTGTANIK